MEVVPCRVSPGGYPLGGSLKVLLVCNNWRGSLEGMPYNGTTTGGPCRDFPPGSPGGCPQERVP